VGKYNEQDFSRLIEEKDFANEVLLHKSHDLLRSAFDLYSKEPDKMNDVIYSIDISIDKHFNTKDKLKVIHILSQELKSFSIVGIRNLYKMGSVKVIEFINELSNTLIRMQDREEGKILEREDIYKNLHQKKVNPDYCKQIGFKSAFTDEQLAKHHQELSGKYISKNTNLANYIAVFKGTSLPVKFVPIKWILLNDKKDPNKTALREFLTLALGKSPDQKTIDICFTDRNGEKIKLAKPKRHEYSKYFAEFEKLLKQ
jgi:hypothetical protein